MPELAVVDSLEFARAAQQLAGTVAVSELKRVADTLFDVRGTLEYAITGGCDSRKRPRLHVEVRGEVNLCCQRCLHSLPYRLNIVADLLVLNSDDVATNEIEDLDGVAADPHTSVLAIVEDEVLLAVPMVPRHPEGQCNIVLRNDAVRGASPLGALTRLKHN